MESVTHLTNCTPHPVHIYAEDKRTEICTIPPG